MASTPAAATTEAALAELGELLRIESISSDGSHSRQLREAAEWIARLIGGAEVTQERGNPIVDGLIPASRPGAPTVAVYGHYDVQAPGDPQLWTSPPFDPQVRDGWLYARGVSDDKGNLYALLRAALDQAAAGELAVNVRVLCDGEEEFGGHSVLHHLAGIDDRIDAAIIFDAHMVGDGRPAITTGLRGLVGFQLTLTSGRQEVHSGLLGGAAANAVHDLNTVLAAVTELPEEFERGIAPVSDAERAGWATLPGGAEYLAEAGATAADDRAAAELYDRIWARPSLTVHSVAAGDPSLIKTSIQPAARASLSLRLAPGQDPAAMQELLERRLRAACPARAELVLEPWPQGSPAWVDPGGPVLQAAFAAIERATGVRPLAVRSGGSVPIGAAFVERGTPLVLSGFGTALDNIHSPNERLMLRNFEWALASAGELYRGLGRALAG